MLLPGERPEEMERPDGAPAARAVVRQRADPHRAQGGLPLPCARGQSILQGPLLPRGRRRAHHAAVRRPGPGGRTARRGEPRVEARLGRSRPGGRQSSTATTSSAGRTRGRSSAGALSRRDRDAAKPRRRLRRARPGGRVPPGACRPRAVRRPEGEAGEHLRHGLFWRDTRARTAAAGSTLPQGWVRPATGGGPILSDDVLGLHWALIGVGVDPNGHMPAEHWSAGSARAARPGSGATARRRSISRRQRSGSRHSTRPCCRGVRRSAGP